MERLFRLRAKAIIIALSCAWFAGHAPAQSADQSDIAALKTEIEQLRKERKEDRERMASMEAQMLSMKANPGNGTILNTRVLTDADGKAVDNKAPVLDDSFLKSLTRNFSFSAYIRAGVAFNGNGGAGDFNFEPPDTQDGRPRLGNENDTYMELTWAQAHLLGDNPDAMDVSMKFTPAIVYRTNRATYIDHNGSGFDFALRQAYLEMKNVFKGAPEVTFWGGQRFYDRYSIDPMDYYWLDTSGYGAGVYNIDVGVGKLWIAYIGGIQDSLSNETNGQTNGFRNYISNTAGNFYKHTIDVRLKDIDLLNGHLALVGILNFQKGGDFRVENAGGAQSFFIQGNGLGTLTQTAGAGPQGVVRTQDAYGAGGGAFWEYDFGNKSVLQIGALFGFGATEFDNSGVNLSRIDAAFNNEISTGRAIQRSDGSYFAVVNPLRDSREFRANVDFTWNVLENFAVRMYAYWDQSSQGFRAAGTVLQGDGTLKSTFAAATRNSYVAGIRPIFWLADNLAIEGQAYGEYQDNDRGYSGSSSFGRSGTMGVFTIAPVIKPKGGYLTRPELRVFATYSIWSNSLIGTTTPVGEGGNFSGAVAPYNAGTNQGWLFGTQIEWFF